MIKVVSQSGTFEFQLVLFHIYASAMDNFRLLSYVLVAEASKSLLTTELQQARACRSPAATVPHVGETVTVGNGRDTRINGSSS